MPPLVDEWLPQKHLARFVIKVVDGLDLSAVSNSYGGFGSSLVHPKVLLSNLIYGYAKGLFRAASWSAPPAIRWRFASSLRTVIPTATLSKRAARDARAATTGENPGGTPRPPVEGLLPTDRANLTGEESRTMPVAGDGFEQCYHAQAVLAADSLLVVATDVVRGPNDKQQLPPC
jgi:hypothetical protein